jgi:hypothetical protein
MIQHGAAMTKTKRRFIDEFAVYLESSVRELKVTEIAEEFNQDALGKSNQPTVQPVKLQQSSVLDIDSVTLEPRNEGNMPSSPMIRENNSG